MMWFSSQTSALDNREVQNAFAMRKARFDWNYWIWIKDLNSIINDSIFNNSSLCFAELHYRRLTKWQYKHFNAAIYMRPSIQNQKLYTFYCLWVYLQMHRFKLQKELLLMLW